MNEPTVFFDSGVGGLPYFSYLKKKYPNEDYIYIADNKNFPYGIKSRETLIEIVSNIISKVILKFKPKAVVIACNTASVTTLKSLRKLTDIPIIGVVPAIKTASEQTNNGNIGVLATKQTVSGDYIKDLIKKYSPHNRNYLIGASEIVDFVENKMLDLSSNKIDDFIMLQVENFIQKKVDTVVLGCTHFIHVSDSLKRVLGDSVKVVDSREGVINQVLRVAKHSNIGVGKSYFFLTKGVDGSEKDKYKKFCSKFEIEYRGEF